MPRTRRIIPKEGALHVMCRGNNKLPVLANETDKKYYFFLLLKLKLDNHVDILHYCIMDNHVHLIVWLREESALPRLMKQANLTYFHYYREKYDYCGHLWQGRYKSILIESDAQALQCGKYIELNPVRANMVKQPEQYQFSSYRYYAFGQPDHLITPNPVFMGLGANPSTQRQTYINFVEEKDSRQLIKKGKSGRPKK